MENPQPPRDPQQPPPPAPAPDPAARFRRPESAAPPTAAPPAPRPALPGPLWFLIGAGAASACWYGYGLMQASMTQSAAAAMAGAGASGQLAGQLQDFMHQAKRSTEQMADAARGGSSLDLVSGPRGEGAPPAPPPGMTQQQVQAINRAGADMIGSLMPLMNNPEMLKNLPPDKRREVQGLSAVLLSMQQSMASGKPLDPKQAEAIMRTVQGMQLTAPAGLGQPPPQQPR